MMRTPEHPRGQAMVEFALVIGIVILLMVGVFDLGRVVFAYNGVSHAARDAARRASVEPVDCEVIFLRVQNATIGQRNVTVTVDLQAAQVDGDSGSDICPAYNPSATYADPSSGSMDASLSPQIGGTVSVTVEQQVFLATPIVSNLVGDSLDIGSESTMTITSYTP